MKYIKKFEKFENILKIGDYVLAISKANDVIFTSYINNSIGEVIKITPVYSKNEGNKYKVYDDIDIRYYGVPKSEIDLFTKEKKHNSYKIKFPSYMIYKFSENKEELEIEINANKFNL